MLIIMPLLFPVSAAHTGIFWMDSSSTSSEEPLVDQLWHVGVSISLFFTRSLSLSLSPTLSLSFSHALSLCVPQVGVQSGALTGAEMAAAFTEALGASPRHSRVYGSHLDPLDKTQIPTFKLLGTYKIPDRSAPTLSVDG